MYNRSKYLLWHLILEKNWEARYSFRVSHKELQPSGDLKLETDLEFSKRHI